MLRRTALSGPKMCSRAASPALVSKNSSHCSGVSQPAGVRDGIWTRTRATPTLVSKTLVYGVSKRRPLSVTRFDWSRPTGHRRRGRQTTQRCRSPDRCSWRATSRTVPAFAWAVPSGTSVRPRPFCRSGACTLADVADKSYGRTAAGREIAEVMIEEFAAEAGAGYDVNGLIARRAAGGRRQLASGPNPNPGD